MKIVTMPFMGKENRNKFIACVLSLMITTAIFAQPGNDNCGGAYTLLPASTCNPTSGTTAGATQTLPATVGTADDDVWYRFVANGPALSVQVTGSSTFNAVVQVYSGSCGGSSIGISNNTANGGTEIVNLSNLFNGVSYWIRVYHSAATLSNNPTFTICVSAPLVEPTCNPNSVEPSNSMSPISDVPKICEVNGFCGTTQGYHATPNATTLTPYSVNTWPELTAAFCGSIENNSFFKFTASQSTVQLRVYGACTSGTGIQMLAFTLNSTGLVNGSGPITSYGCFSPLNLNPSPTQGVPLAFSGMTAGQTYYVMVDGFAGAICNYKIAADFGVQVSTNISASATSTCLGNTLTLTASGGNGSYTWLSNPDLSGTTGSVVTATPSTTGQVFYVVTSASLDPSCPATADTSFINVQTIPTPNSGIDDSVCLGQSIILNGALSNPSNSKLWQFVPPAGPTPVVTFSPNFSHLTPTVSVNRPGLYQFILRETSQLCGQYRDTVRILVIEPTQTLISSAPNCFGSNDGIIEVQSAYGDEYSFDNGISWTPLSVMNGFTAGTYNVCSRNYLGCSTCSQVIVPDGVQSTISVSQDTLVCENGTASISALGGGGNTFTYHWAHTNNTTDLQQVQPSGNSYYSVYAENEDGCLSPKDSVYVMVRPGITSSISVYDTICPGENSTIAVQSSGGFGAPYNYSWTDGYSASGNGNSHEVSPSATSVYTVTITDNCESTPVVLSSEIYVSPIPVPEFTVDANQKCEPAIFDLSILSPSNTYSTSTWFIEDGQIFSNQDAPQTVGMYKGSYDVQLVLANQYGCVDSITYADYLLPQPVPEAKFLFNPGQPTMFNTQVKFENVSTDATSYSWTFEQGSPSASNLENPEVFFPDGISGNYEVTLDAVSAFGCSNKISQIVKVLPEVILYAPNTFTPDGDQFNQNWNFVLEGIDEYTFDLEIRNRWGQLIFHSKDLNQGWDGTMNGEPIPAGVYTWNMQAKDILSDKVYVFNGMINLIR